MIDAQRGNPWFSSLAAYRAPESSTLQSRQTVLVPGKEGCSCVLRPFEIVAPLLENFQKKTFIGNKVLLSGCRVAGS